jgi:hypothetical protein
MITPVVLVPEIGLFASQQFPLQNTLALEHIDRMLCHSIISWYGGVDTYV